MPTPKSSSPFPASSTFTRISKQAPSPFQIGSRHRHPLDDGVSRSASQSTGRSFQPSRLSSSTRGQLRGGDVIEITHIGYQHTNSSLTPSVSASGQNPTRRTSETGVGAGSLISEYKPHAPPSRSLERLSSVTGTASHTSMLDSSSYTSRSHLLSQAQLINNTSQHSVNIVQPARRPLPVPPHPPPAYEQVSSTDAQVVSTIPNNSIDAEPLTGSTLAGIQSPNPKAQAHARSSSADETQYSRAQSLDPGVIPVLSSASENAKMGSSRGEPAFLRRSMDVVMGDAREEDDLDMETAMTPHSHRRHPSSGEHDPFVNMNYELPAWITSDPYPAQRLRPSASQPSLYGAVARSVAASSRVLPSDTSIRTLTPEPISSPLSPLPGEEVMSPNGPPNEAAYRRYSQTPTYVSTAPPTRPVSAIVGDGPAVDELLVFHGAERPGWAESSPLPLSKSSGSRIRRKFPDRFEAEDLHPAASPRAAAPSSPDSTAVTSANSRSADRETTFMPLSPLSEVAPVQGLSRAFSLDAPQRRAFTPRGRGRATGRSPLLDRSFGTLSSFRGARSGLSSSIGTEEAPLSASSSRRMSADNRARDSVVPSSSGLPPDAMSIRSISPEIGWMEDPALPEDSGQAQEHLASIKEGEQIESVPTEAPAFGAKEASGRASRMSITEDVALWGRLTSALEQEQRPSEPRP